MATISKIETSKGETRYRARVVVGHRPDGSAKQELRTFATKREATRWAAQQEADVARGTAVADAKMSLGAYLDAWLARSERRVRESTLSSYRWQVGRWIAGSDLAGVQLGRLTPATVQKWLDAIPLASSAKKIRTVLGIALNEATRLGLLAANPVSRTTSPTHTPKEGTAWTVEDARRFLAVARNDSYAPYWELALFLGMRPSEITALRWSSVNLDLGTLGVDRARPCAGGKTYEAETTKSPSGRRTLSLPPQLIAALWAHSAEQRRLHPTALDGSGLVCTNTVGTPCDQRALQRRFHRLCRQAGVPEITLYSTRHTATSLMLRSGGDLKAVSESLGHSDPTLTLKVYQHTQGDQRARALALLANNLAPIEPMQAAQR